MEELFFKTLIEWLPRIAFMILGAGVTGFTMWRHRRKMIQSFKDLKTEVDNLIKGFAGKSAKLVERNEPKIWDNFIGPDFRSYNDPWTMEMENPGNFKQIHIKRYNNHESGVYNFLFFTKKDYYAFERFVKFQSIVHLGMDEKLIENSDFKTILKNHIVAHLTLYNKLPETLKKINVWFNNTAEKPLVTFFTGYKQEGKFALLYYTINENEKQPPLIIETSDFETCKYLDTIWDKAKEESTKVDGIKIFDEFLKFSNTKINA
jgi:hypothetical protein